MAPLTQLQQKWLDAGKALTPQGSLQAADTLGKFIFANAAIVGTVITGFGLFGSAAPVLQRGPHFLSIPLAVALLGLSLLLALGAIVPHFGTPNPASINEIERFYRGTIKRRALFACAAALAFAAAIVAATAIAVVDHSPTNAAPSIKAQITGTGSTAKLTVDVTLANISHASTVTTTVRARRGRTGAAHSLCDVVTTSAVGPVSDHCDAAVGPYHQFAIRTVVTRGKQTVTSGTLSLRR